MVISRIIPPPKQVISERNTTPKMSVSLSMATSAPATAKETTPRISMNNKIESIIIYPSFSRRSARAFALWLMEFFSSSVISATVLVSPVGIKRGS